MKIRWMVLVFALVALPSLLYASWSKNIVRIKSPATGAVVFNHQDHFDALGRNCTRCHDKIFSMNRKKNPSYTMKQMEKGQACGACHNGQEAFDVRKNCSICHPTRDITFKVPDMGPVTFSHEVHTSMFGCSECHPDLFVPGPGNKPATMDEMAKGASCGACHDGNMAFSVTSNCDTCHQM